MKGTIKTIIMVMLLACAVWAGKCTEENTGIRRLVYRGSIEFLNGTLVDDEVLDWLGHGTVTVKFYYDGVYNAGVQMSTDTGDNMVSLAADTYSMFTNGDWNPQSRYEDEFRDHDLDTGFETEETIEIELLHALCGI